MARIEVFYEKPDEKSAYPWRIQVKDGGRLSGEFRVAGVTFHGKCRTVYLPDNPGKRGFIVSDGTLEFIQNQKGEAYALITSDPSRLDEV